jgi:hypothetical protein
MSIRDLLLEVAAIESGVPFGIIRTAEKATNGKSLSVEAVSPPAAGREAAPAVAPRLASPKQ